MALQIAAVQRRGFQVIIEPRLFHNEVTGLAADLEGQRTLVITTPTVHKFYGDQVRAFLARTGLTAAIEVLPLRECCKTMKTVEEICALSISHRLGRNDTLRAMGGGVCSGLVGVSDALVRRGIRHVRVPTTLVGQI